MPETVVEQGMSRQGGVVQVMGFGGHPLTVVEHQGERYVTVPELAAALGVERRLIHDTVYRHREEFDGFTCVVSSSVLGVQTREGNPSERLLNFEGVIGVLMLISRSRVANPEARDTILAFRKWALSTLRAVMEGRYVTSPSPDPTESQIRALELQVELARLQLERERVRAQEVMAPVEAKAIEMRQTVAVAVIGLLEKYPLAQTEVLPMVAGVLGTEKALAEPLYTSEDLATRFTAEMDVKVSAQRIGRLCTRLGWRIEAGETEFLLVSVTKAAHADKVITQIKYKPAGVAVLRRELEPWAADERAKKAAKADQQRALI